MSSGNETPLGSASASPRQSLSINISSEDLLPLSTLPTSSQEEISTEFPTHLASIADDSSAPFIPSRRTSSISVQNLEKFETGGSADRLDTIVDDSSTPPVPSRKASILSFQSMPKSEPEESFGVDESAVPFIITRKASSISIPRPSVHEDAAVEAHESDQDDETVLNFSMRVKSRVPVAREDPKKELREKAHDPTRYRPQVLINDWYEVSQRLELNKGRHLKLQKGPYASAYDWHYQHPFAKKMVDPEECERRMAARNRRLWTYLRDPTEYSDNFNEPFRKK